MAELQGTAPGTHTALPHTCSTTGPDTHHDRQRAEVCVLGVACSADGQVRRKEAIVEPCQDVAAGEWPLQICSSTHFSGGCFSSLLRHTKQNRGSGTGARNQAATSRHQGCQSHSCSVNAFASMSSFTSPAHLHIALGVAVQPLVLLWRRRGCGGCRGSNLHGSLGRVVALGRR